jgi:hypothetical protein
VGTLDKDAEVKAYKFKVRVTGENEKGETVYLGYKVSLKVVPDPSKKEKDFGATEDLRLVGGYEFSRASSSKGSQTGFFDAYFSQPLPGWAKFNKTREKLQMKPWRIWGNIRFSSVPQQNEKNIGALGPDFFSDLTKLKFNEITNSAEFIAGLDITLWRINNSNSHYTLGLVFAAGAITPLKATSENVRIFKISDAFKERYPEEDYSDDPGYVAFVPQDRDRFYHQYYFGLRFKKYSHKNGKENGKNTFPAMFDVTWGLNDAASGGKGHLFKKSVFRLDGFLPFDLIHGFPMYLYGTVVLNTSKEKLGLPLFLDPVTEEDDVSPTSPNLLTIPVPESDRDYYRIGIGIDLTSLIKKSNGKNNSSKQ